MDNASLIELIHKLNNKTCVTIGRAEIIDLKKLDAETQDALNVIIRNLYDINKILKNFRSKLNLV